LKRKKALNKKRINEVMRILVRMAVAYTGTIHPQVLKRNSDNLLEANRKFLVDAPEDYDRFGVSVSN
jgi:hypothetical protein